MSDFLEFNDPLCKSNKTIAFVRKRSFVEESKKCILEIALSYCNFDDRIMNYRIIFVKKKGKHIFKIIEFKFTGQYL